MRTHPERAGQALRAHADSGSTRGYLYQLLAIGSWTSVAVLKLIRQPTLVLSGDDDPLIPLANARLMHSLIRRSQLHVYHGGHLGLVTEAAELAPVVGRFLAAGPPAGARDA